MKAEIKVDVPGQQAYLKKNNAVFNCKSEKISDKAKSVNKQIGN